MKLHLGIKSDPIENRYSFDWLFSLCGRMGIRYIQLGGFFEIAVLEDEYFKRLRDRAESKGIRFKSVFTAHREVHGWFTGDRYMERAARKIYERLIHAGSLLGADYVGSSAGSVLRDMAGHKNAAMECYLSNMKELQHYAFDKGLKGLTIEVMSCDAEPPTFPDEIDFFMQELQGYHNKNRTNTVQAYILGDTSHGYADRNGKVVFTNEQLFEKSIPYMPEFHFKNTDAMFNSTFGFSESECRKGIVGLDVLKEMIFRNESLWPVPEITGYLEHPGPKLGRDYTDYKLESMLVESLTALKSVFDKTENAHSGIDKEPALKNFK